MSEALCCDAYINSEGEVTTKSLEDIEKKHDQPRKNKGSETKPTNSGNECKQDDQQQGLVSFPCSMINRQKSYLRKQMQIRQSYELLRFYISSVLSKNFSRDSCTCNSTYVYKQTHKQTNKHTSKQTHKHILQSSD